MIKLPAFIVVGLAKDPFPRCAKSPDFEQFKFLRFIIVIPELTPVQTLMTKVFGHFNLNDFFAHGIIMKCFFSDLWWRNRLQGSCFIKYNKL